MIYLIIFNVLLMIWLYKKYIYIPKYDENNYEILDKLDPALIGYIDNENGNTVDWILAEILELSRKKYITIDYVREGIDEYNYIFRKRENIDIQNMEKYELTAYRLIFDYCDEITMDELEQKIQTNIISARDTNVKGFSIKNEIEEKLEEIGIYSSKIRKQLKFIQKFYIIMAVILAFIIKKFEISSVIIFLIQSLIIFYMLKKARGFTNFGKSIYNTVKQYKQKLQENDLLKDRKIVHNIVLEKEYANATALHIMTDAKEEFINDELRAVTITNIIISFIAVIYVIYEIISIFIK